MLDGMFAWCLASVPWWAVACFSPVAFSGWPQFWRLLCLYSLVHLCSALASSFIFLHPIQPLFFCCSRVTVCCLTDPFSGGRGSGFCPVVPGFFCHGVALCAGMTVPILVHWSGSSRGLSSGCSGRCLVSGPFSLFAFCVSASALHVAAFASGWLSPHLSARFQFCLTGFVLACDIGAFLRSLHMRSAGTRGILASQLAAFVPVLVARVPGLSQGCPVGFLPGFCTWVQGGARVAGSSFGGRRFLSSLLGPPWPQVSVPGLVYHFSSCRLPFVGPPFSLAGMVRVFWAAVAGAVGG